MATETIWLAHDNTVDLQLQKDGVALTDDEMDAITKITASLGSILIESTNQAADPIRWRQAGYDTGEIRLSFGAESIPAREYRMRLVVYDTANTGGVVWHDESFPYVKVRVRSDPEPTS